MNLGGNKPQYTLDDLQIKNAEGKSLDIHLIAVNNDNLLHAEQLANLFRDAYSATGQYSDLHSVNFWYNGAEDSESNNELTSIVAFSNGQIIAHLGIRQPKESSAVEILYTLVAEEFKDHSFAIAAHYSQFLRGLYRKQKWSSVTHYISVLDAIPQIVATKYFRSCEIALILGTDSDKESSADDASPIGNFVVMRNEVALSELNHPLSLFPPTQHTDKIIELYNTLNIQRYWQLSASTVTQIRKLESRNTATPNTSLAKANLGVSAEYRQLFKSHELLLTPSLLELEHLKEIALSDRKQFLLVAMDDALCPAVCEELEKVGYVFTGIFPEHLGRDYVCYCQTTAEQLSRTPLFTEGGIALRDYIVNYLQKHPQLEQITPKNSSSLRRANLNFY